MPAVPVARLYNVRVRPALPCVLAAWLITGWLTAAQAAAGSIAYSARVVHNNRSQLSYVHGSIDLASGDFVETVERSYNLNWRQLPGQMLPASVALPTVWGVAGRSAQRYGPPDGAGGNLPRFDSPLLRHFIVGNVLADVEALQPKQAYLSGQLLIETAEINPDSFEIVASFRGALLVVVGRRESEGPHPLVRDVAVLGTEGELYQYFIESMQWSPDPPLEPVTLPAFNPADYVVFPPDAAQPVPITPVKDWMVFQAELPSGRPLNLVFDSGADRMIIDDWVLKLDAGLKPAGELPVAGALETGHMQQYEGFALNIGGVQFKNLSVIGTQLTSLGYGADMRIHGVVGNEILQLCRIDLDLEHGEMRLSPPGTEAAADGEQLPLTFIRELPHVEAQVEDAGAALLLVDTGQRAPLSVNLDWLDSYELGDKLKMNGFLGDVTGGLAPRYIVEELDFSLAGQTYREKTVDAAMDYTYSYEGLPVVGSIGFSLLARHFGGITFDYSRKLLYLRNPAEHRVFAGQPDAWNKPGELVANADPEAAPAATAAAEDLPQLDPRRPVLLRERQREQAAFSFSWGGMQAVQGDPLELIRATSPPTGSVAPDAALIEGGVVLSTAVRDATRQAAAAVVPDVSQPAAPEPAAAPPVEPAPAVAAALPEPVVSVDAAPAVASAEPAGLSAQLRLRLDKLCRRLWRAVQQLGRTL